jgi:hypothetical protein
MDSALLAWALGIVAEGLAILTFTSMLYCALVVVAALAVRRGGRPTVSRPGASILVALCGTQPSLRANLEALRAALGPEDELLVGAARSDDPAIAIAREAFAGDERVRIMAGSGSRATNPKVATLVVLERLVTRETVVLVDSDVRLNGALLNGLVAPLVDPRTGLATALYRGVPSGSLASRLEALSINVDFIPSVLVSHLLNGGIDFALGAANAIRREVLVAIGGIASLGDVLADDHILEKRVSQAGYRVTIAPVCVPIWLDSPLGDTVTRLLRWCRTYRVCQPSGYAATLFSHHGVTCAAMTLGLTALGGNAPIRSAVLLLATVVLVRTIGGLVAHTLGAGREADLRSLPFLGLRDLVGSALFIAAWSGRDVTWRGTRFRVACDGALHRDVTARALEAGSVVARRHSGPWTTMKPGLLAGLMRLVALARDGRLVQRVPAPVLIGLVWAIAVLPNLSVRSFMWEEGNNAELARDVLARGDLFEPAIFGLRYVEKPSLLAWLIAGTARLTGRSDEWSARLPSLLATLGTALLVQRLTRRHAGASAALFAAGAFMFCPLVLRKLTIGEPDTLVTFLSFAAFVVWWDGEARGRVSAGRWLACGGLLAALAMVKGPQPIAFFALGVGGVLIVRQRWAALPGLALCLALPASATVAWAAAVYHVGDLPVWFAYMRLDARFDLWQYLRERVRFAGGLPLDLLPGTIVLASVLVFRWRHSSLRMTPSPILRPLVFYAGLCMLALLVWPGTKTRYAMPAAPAVAVLAGLTVEPLWRRRHWTVTVAGALVGVLFVYQVLLVTVVMPRSADHFGGTHHLGAAIDTAVRESPAPLFTIGAPQSNKLFYVTWPVRGLMLPDAAATLSAPAWVLASASDLKRSEALRPDLAFSVVTTALPGPGLLLARVERRPAEGESLGEESVTRLRPALAPTRDPECPPFGPTAVFSERRTRGRRPPRLGSDGSARHIGSVRIRPRALHAQPGKPCDAPMQPVSRSGPRFERLFVRGGLNTFGEITVMRATLTVRILDEQGQTLVSHMIRAED